MLFQQIDKKDILRIVMENVGRARKEIIATMLIADELDNPLPSLYFNLLRKKINEGIFLERLGFGSRKEYATISKRIGVSSKNYLFRYRESLSKCQRLIVVDNRILFFRIENLFFTSTNKLIVRAFSEYFYINFKKAKR